MKTDQLQSLTCQQNVIKEKKKESLETHVSEGGKTQWPIWTNKTYCQNTYMGSVKGLNGAVCIRNAFDLQTKQSTIYVQLGLVL